MSKPNSMLLPLGLAAGIGLFLWRKNAKEKSTEPQNENGAPQEIPEGTTPPIISTGVKIKLPPNMTKQRFDDLRKAGKILTGKEMVAVALRAKRDLLIKRKGKGFRGNAKFQNPKKESEEI